MTKTEKIDVTDYFIDNFKVLRGIKKIIFRFNDERELYLDVILHDRTRVGEKITTHTYDMTKWQSYLLTFGYGFDTSLEDTVSALTEDDHVSIFYTEVKIIEPPNNYGCRF